MIILVYIVEASGLKYPNHKIVTTASLGRNVLESKISSPRNTTRFDSNLAWKTDINSIKRPFRWGAGETILDCYLSQISLGIIHFEYDRLIMPENTCERMKSDNVPIKIECFCIGKDGSRELIGFVVVPLRSVSILTGNKVLSITPKWHRLIGLRQSWKSIKPEILMFVTITDTIGVQIINEMRNTTSMATKNMLIPQHDIYIALNKDEQHIQIGNSLDDSHRFTIEILWLHCEWLTYLTENPSTEESFHMRYTLLDCPTEERNLPKMCGMTDEERYLVQEKISIQLRSSLRSIRRYFENVFYIPIYIYCKQEILGRLFFKIERALPDTNDLNEFLVLTKDNTFVAINEAAIYPTKSNATFIDEEHRPILKYNFTLKYHPPLAESDGNHQANENKNLNEHYQEDDEQTGECNQEPDKNHQQLENRPKFYTFCDYKVPNELDETTSRETVERSINARNQLIQRLLHTEIDSPKMDLESFRFVNVPSEPYRHSLNQNANVSSSKIENVGFVGTVPLDMNYCFPKNIKTNVQLDADLVTWKAREQESFLKVLKKKENEHLMSLAKEWITRHSQQEEKLASKMKNCKLLTESLEHALNAVKEKKLNSVGVTQLEQKKINEDKISALSEQIRHFEIDHDYQLKTMELKLKETDMCRRFTSEENEKLKVTVNKLEGENQLLRENYRELDASLSKKLQSIEMQLKHAQELELFYKDKWMIAEAKLTGVRTNKEVKLRQTEKNLSNHIVEVLNSVRSDLEADKFELQSIKDMLD